MREVEIDGDELKVGTESYKKGDEWRWVEVPGDSWKVSGDWWKVGGVGWRCLKHAWDCVEGNWSG